MTSILFLFLILNSGETYAVKLHEFDTHKACLVTAEKIKGAITVPADTKDAVLICAHTNLT